MDEWDKKKKKIKEELEDNLEIDEDSDEPLHEKYTEMGKFKKSKEEE